MNKEIVKMNKELFEKLKKVNTKRKECLNKYVNYKPKNLISTVEDYAIINDLRMDIFNSEQDVLAIVDKIIEVEDK